MIGVVTDLIPFNYETRDMLVSLGRTIKQANDEVSVVMVNWNDKFIASMTSTSLIDIYPYRINETE